MSMCLKGRLAAVLVAALICISCGDVYRPTIVPEPVTPPDPQNFHAAFTANTNGTANPGSTTQIDVSGDTISGIVNLGIGPVHLAVQPASSVTPTRVWSANPGSSSVTVFSSATTTGAISTATTINLPINPPPNNTLPMPAFVHSTEPGTMYVANSDPNYDNVLAIDTGTNSIVATIPVGTHPWAMAETPDGHKLYVVNRDSNDVTSINTTDRSVLPPISVGTSPQWAIARSDSHRVWVLASDGTVSNINSEYTSGTVDTVLNTFSVSADTGLPVIWTSTFFYDNSLNRLHIPFMTPVAGGVVYEDAIYNAATDPPALLNLVPVTGTLTEPCAQCTPISATALQDGTRAYIASYTIDPNTTNCASTQVLGYAPQSCIAIQVAVINELNNTLIKVVKLPEVAISPVKTPGTPPVLVTTPVDCSNPNVTRFRMMTASSVDSSKVYVSNCDAGGVAAIRTSDNTYVTMLKAPASLLDPIRYNTGTSATSFPPPQSPMFLVVGP
jgi:YVTN family beta-propeller protein